jgi:hypothetical protein
VHKGEFWIVGGDGRNLTSDYLPFWGFLGSFDHKQKWGFSLESSNPEFQKARSLALDPSVNAS